MTVSGENPDVEASPASSPVLAIARSNTFTTYVPTAPANSTSPPIAFSPATRPCLRSRSKRYISITSESRVDSSQNCQSGACYYAGCPYSEVRGRGESGPAVKIQSAVPSANFVDSYTRSHADTVFLQFLADVRSNRRVHCTKYGIRPTDQLHFNSAVRQGVGHFHSDVPDAHYGCFVNPPDVIFSYTLKTSDIVCIG
jgi:hypothetical protein